MTALFDEHDDDIGGRGYVCELYATEGCGSVAVYTTWPPREPFHCTRHGLPQMTPKAGA